MTIVAIWRGEGAQWCVTDTRLVSGRRDKPTTDIATKIFIIPITSGFMNTRLNPRPPINWTPNYRTEYGFAYAGAALPAAMTAATASTLFQKLARPDNRSDPPEFERLAEVVRRLAERFMTDYRRFGSDGLFSAAFFGWCPHSRSYKVAHINGRSDADIFRVELSYPPCPDEEEYPWLVLGSAAQNFWTRFNENRSLQDSTPRRSARRVITQMVDEQTDQTVGGEVSLGIANPFGFDLYFTLRPITYNPPAACRIFNGLDLDAEVGGVGDYFIVVNGMA